MKPLHSFALTPLVAAMALANTQHVNAAVVPVCQSQYTVDSLTDGGGVSLTEVLAEIDICDYTPSTAINIQLSSSLAGSTITLANRISLDGGKTVSVEGPSEKVIVTNTLLTDDLIYVTESSHLTLKNIEFDGENNIRTQALLQASGSSSSLSLDNVTIKNVRGNQNQASAIHIYDSQITIKNSEIKSNSMSNTGTTAGIFSVAGEIVIEDSIFEDNTATADSQTPNGAAIYHTASEFSLGSINLLRSEFKNNATRNYGGAVSVTGADNLTIQDTVFDSNTVVAAANEAGTGSNAEAHGGALSIRGDTTTSIVGSTFTNNQANNYGGALYIKVNTGTEVSISDSTFDSNAANYSASESTLGHGAAIYVDAGSETTLDIDRSTLSNNTAYGRGGALYIASGELTLNVKNTTISGNSASSGAAMSMTDGLKDDAGSHIAHSTIVNNTASDTPYTIGAITGDGNPHLTISHSIVANNFGNTGQLCVSESSVAYALDNTIISNGDVDVRSGCRANTDNGGNQIGTTAAPINVMLEDLADNGGSTKTHYPKLGSPVIDTGNANIENEPDTDQRGNDRLMRGAIDIGAVEYGNLAPKTTDLVFEDPGLTEGNDINLDVSGYFTDAEGDSLSFSATGLPNGASISDAGIISGQLSESGQFNITIRAQDAYGAYTETTVSITIAAKPPVDSGSGSGSLNLIWMGLFATLGLRRRAMLSKKA